MLIGKFLKGIGMYEKARDLKWRFKKKNQAQECFDKYGMDTLNTQNEGATHQQFFTMRKFKKLLESYNFQILKHKNTYFLLGAYPISSIYSKYETLQKIDCIMARNLPSFMASDWSFTIRYK